MGKDLISIIIPVYNAEECLVECIESILKQSYQNIEVILIDDGSTDSSGKICDAFSCKDQRIRTFHKENGGQSSARNYGISKVVGNYIMFVDSDDTIEKDMCSILYHRLLEENADIAFCSARFVYPTRETIEKNECPLSLTGMEAARLMLLSLISCAPWGKLYKKDVINELKFVEGRIHEDFQYLFYAFLNSKKVIYIPEVLYRYNCCSLGVSSDINIKKRFDVYLNTKEVLDFCREKMPHLEDAAFKQYAIHGVVNRILDIVNYDQKENNWEIYQELMNAFKANRSRIFTYLSLRERIKLLLIQYTPRLYKVLYHWINLCR